MSVGELMYIAINTRSEISYSVNQCSRYMTNATKAQYEVLKQILRYLAGVKHLKLTWCASKSLEKGLKLFQIYAFSDTRAREVEISFYRKRKCFSFSSFPKKEFLSLRRFTQPEEGNLWSWTKCTREQTRLRCGHGCFLVSPYLVLLHQ